MQNQPLTSSAIFCCERQSDASDIDCELANTFQQLQTCTLSGLQSRVDNIRQSVVVFSWHKPCSELSMATQYCISKGCTVIVLIEDVYSNNINHLDGFQGCVLLPTMANYNLATWLEYAHRVGENYRSTQNELEQLSQKFEERKTIDRAKSILMKQNKMDEAEAHSTLQKAAMEARLSLGTAAKRLIAAAEQSR